MKKISFYFISILFIVLISIKCPAQLVKAIKNGDVKEVEKLIATGADVNEAYNKSPHNPPLYFAIKANQLEMSRLLLKSGADPNRCCILYNAMNATSSCWRLIFYAGHGLPDEQTKEPYLIPVDINGSDLKYAVRLADVYKKLTENSANKVTVYIDACFSGGARNESLVALRGVRVKPRENIIGNNLVVFTSSSGEGSSAS